MNAIKLREMVLERGSHANIKAGVCVMEAVSYVAGEPFGDCPDTACPVISAFLRRLNDNLNNEDRQELKRFVPLLIGSKSSAGVEGKRLAKITDWVCGVGVPLIFDKAGLTKEAKQLRELGPNADWEAIKKECNLNYVALIVCCCMMDSLSEHSIPRAASRCAAAFHCLDMPKEVQDSAMRLVSECLEIK